MAIPEQLNQQILDLAKELGEVREGVLFFRVVDLAVGHLPPTERDKAADLLCTAAAYWVDQTVHTAAVFLNHAHEREDRPVPFLDP